MSGRSPPGLITRLIDGFAKLRADARSCSMGRWSLLQSLSGFGLGLRSRAHAVGLTFSQRTRRAWLPYSFLSRSSGSERRALLGPRGRPASPASPGRSIALRPSVSAAGANPAWDSGLSDIECERRELGIGSAFDSRAYRAAPPRHVSTYRYPGKPTASAIGMFRGLRYRVSMAGMTGCDRLLIVGPTAVLLRAEHPLRTF